MKYIFFLATLAFSASSIFSMNPPRITMVERCCRTELARTQDRLGMAKILVSAAEMAHDFRLQMYKPDGSAAVYLEEQASLEKSEAALLKYKKEVEKLEALSRSYKTRLDNLLARQD